MTGIPAPLSRHTRTQRNACKDLGRQTMKTLAEAAPRFPYSPTKVKTGRVCPQRWLRVLYLTITELARESHTSEASVTRLCRRSAAKAGNEFKMALALDIQQGQPARVAGDEN